MKMKMLCYNKTMKTFFGTIVGISLVFTTIAGCGSNAKPGTGASGTVVTKAKHDQLQTGMTYEQVTSVIGNPGEKAQDVVTPAGKGTLYVWKNSDGSNMAGVFQDNKLLSKSHTSLK
jgi:predicted small lipoprotein YifL